MSCTQKSKFCNSIIDELQDYMLFKQKLDEAFKSVVVIKSSERPPTDQKYKKEHCVVKESVSNEPVIKFDNRFKPYQTDSLFWCFYILLNGYDAYETVNNHFVVENEEKIKMIELLRTSKKIIKEHKWGSSENDISLIGQPISITTFATLCGLHKLKVFFVDEINRTFCSGQMEQGQSEGEGEESVHVLYKSATSLRFECELNVSKAYLMESCAGYYQILSIHKPINAISSYTIKELNEMCRSLSLDYVLVKDNLGKPLSKQHLYQALCSKLGVTKDEPKVK